VDARRGSYAARFAARREQLPPAAQLRAVQPPARAAWLRLSPRGAGEALADAAAAELRAYGASKRQAVAVRGGHAAWAGGSERRAWHAMAPQPAQGDSPQRRGGGRRWLLVPATDEPARGPKHACADQARRPPAHAGIVAAHDTRVAGSVGLGDAHVRHFQNLSLCRELQSMQLQVS